jgi:hypothetical protein
MSVPQARGIRGRQINQWSHDEPAGEPAVASVRTAFDMLLEVSTGLEDPEFHDGWQPVRARSSDPGSE